LENLQKVVFLVCLPCKVYVDNYCELTYETLKIRLPVYRSTWLFIHN